MTESRTERARAYYRQNSQKIIERNKAWLENDPTGEKKKKAMISKMKSSYRKKPSIARALSIYALVYGVDKDAIDKPVSEVKKEIDTLVFVMQ